MKISIALSAIILAIGMGAGLMHQQQLTTLRQDREQLATKAAELGIHVESLDPSGRPKLTKRQYEDRDNPTRPVIEQISAYGRAMEELRLSSEDIGPVLQKQGWDLMERMMDLDPEEMKQIIESLVAEKPRPEPDKARRNMIELSVRMLAEDHPEAALSLFTASKNLMEELENGGTVIKTSLANWAKKDPAAALAWIEQSWENVPAIDRDEMKSCALAGAAQTDPKLAFKLLSETEMDREYAIGVIAEAAKSPEDRTATLSAFRNYLTTVSNPDERDTLRKKALGGLAESLSGESFAPVTNWIAGQNLSTQECDEVASALPEEATSAETGKWIAWMADSLPPEKLGARVDQLIAPWAQQDCQAVAKWLGEEPEGPARTAAISAYAKTVSEHEPQVAAQWAMTMPAGQEREDTLKGIYRNWPNKDAAAKAAFATEHGITPDLTSGK